MPIQFEVTRPNDLLRHSSGRQPTALLRAWGETDAAGRAPSGWGPRGATPLTVTRSVRGWCGSAVTMAARSGVSCEKPASTTREMRASSSA